MAAPRPTTPAARRRHHWSFRHTVQTGQNTADLTVTAIALNGATVVDGSNNPADLSGAVSNPGGILQVDTTPPTIGTVTTTPSNDAVGTGAVVTFNIPTSEAVTVSSGTPTLTLNDGGIATYDAANSTATNLVFDYVVQAGDATPDLTITGSNLNGATIADFAGNALDLSGVASNPPGTLQVNTTRPTVVSVMTQGTGIFDAGDIVTIDVIPNEDVTVAGGTPTLTLNDGGTAVYDAADSTPAHLVFKYTVQPGEYSTALAVTAANLNGATIKDAKGNDLIFSAATGDLPGSLEVLTVPVVNSVVTFPANADLRAGETVELQITSNAPVFIYGGTPTLQLNDGGTAVYDAASSTPTQGIYRYTVAAGENTPDLSIVGASANGAVILDGQGRYVAPTGLITNPDGILQIDTIAPTSLSLVMTGSLEPGSLYTMTFTYSEPVVRNGPLPDFVFANGAVVFLDVQRSTPTTAVFSYTVQPGDTPQSLAIVGFDQNGNVTTDLAGNLLDDASVGQSFAAAQGNFSDTIEGQITPTTIDVYRFFDTKNGTHFYTADTAERSTILSTRPDLVPEGPNGVGLTAVNPSGNDPNAAPVFRFFDATKGTQFLTASASERDNVIATRPDLVYEPASTFFEHTTPQPGDTAVYRYFDATTGTHFYTDSAIERATVMQTRPDLIAEGIGFYEPLRHPAT